uniref:Uncharacterized protein n=1 Tax=Schistosoma curassoni TaxID=6186 RepID=A0A183KSQ0_9TREM
MSKQFYCMGRKPGELRKPSSTRYRCLLIVVYAIYFGSVDRTLSATTYYGREQTRFQEEIRKKRWKWTDHTLRKAPNCVTRQALIWNHQGQRRRGRPKNTKTGNGDRHDKNE